MLDVYINIAFGCNFALAIVILTIARYCYKKETKDFVKFDNPICENEVCKHLEQKMIDLMKKRLDYQDDQRELSIVIRHLNKMYNEVHNDESKDKRCHAMFQCLRTTLVQHPDDIRGRRRAVVAKDIFINEVLEEPSKFHYFVRCFSWLYDCLTCYTF